ncbi:MAG: hypothetical protein Q8P58_01970 [Candidatus Adlerbacteria bacterium]|nr:hypothetical protein [Candidatus Adlerbacteria bacterium]
MVGGYVSVRGTECVPRERKTSSEFDEKEINSPGRDTTQEAKMAKTPKGGNPPNDDAAFGQLGEEIKKTLDESLASRDAAIKAVDAKADEALEGVAKLKVRPLLPPSAIEAFRRGLKGSK